MYVPRAIRNAVEKGIAGFPAVLLVGPRQSGKSTFLHQEFGDRFATVSLDDPRERAFCRADPVGFLNRFPGPLIIDEVQYAPDLLPYLKTRVEAARRTAGRWILTGSQQFQFMRGVSESLAGRIALLELLPFGLLERPPGSDEQLADVLWNGCYPEPALNPERRDLWLKSYVATYLERDLRQVLAIRDLTAFETFLALAATRHGQEFHLASIARGVGVSVPTIKAWTGVLQASMIIFLLQPYHRNLGKRLIRAPKLFFLDPALPSFLTRQSGPEAALAGPMGGALLEGLVVAEAVKWAAHRGDRPAIWFWRSHDGLEVDLLVQAGQKLVPIEIKRTATPMPRHAEGLSRFRELAGKLAAEVGLLVCRVPYPVPLPHGNLAIPWMQFPTWLAGL
jgi:predicted AAA+ superfamily ATPase